MSPTLKKRLWLTVKISCFSGVLSGIFSLITVGFTLQSLIFFVCVGFFCAFLGFGVETLWLSRIFRRTPVWTQILLKTFFYILLILAVLWAGSFFLSAFGKIGLENLKVVRGVIFGTGLSFFFALWVTLNAVLGRGVLRKLILGLNFKPKEEDRIFMFLDMKDSTRIAEEIGHEQFLRLLNDFYSQMTDAVFHYRAEIYKYVGDEVILSWKRKQGFHEARCVGCFFEIRNRIQANRSFFLKKYGRVPEFKAGIHAGRVVSGQLGEIKIEIAYIGDVLNTAARIQAQCGPQSRELLISGEVYENIPKNQAWVFESLGALDLKGKQQAVELYAVSLSLT